MNPARYELYADDSHTTYSFTSLGPNGSIEKLVQFTLIDAENMLYNLAFGDKDSLSGYLNDQVVSDNGDSEKVLATVVAAVYRFCHEFPGACVYATGSSSARTRLYRMGINKYFDIVEADFLIFGETPRA